MSASFMIIELSMESDSIAFLSIVLILCFVRGVVSVVRGMLLMLFTKVSSAWFLFLVGVKVLLLVTKEGSCGSLSWKNSASLIFLVNSRRSCLIWLTFLWVGVGANFNPFERMCFSVGVRILEERLNILMSVFSLLVVLWR